MTPLQVAPGIPPLNDYHIALMFSKFAAAKDLIYHISWDIVDGYSLQICDVSDGKWHKAGN